MKKRFGRTIAGKILLFAGCVLSVSLIFAALYTKSELDRDYPYENEQALYVDLCEGQARTDAERMIAIGWEEIQGLGLTKSAAEPYSLSLYSDMEYRISYTVEEGTSITFASPSSLTASYDYIWSYWLSRTNGKLYYAEASDWEISPSGSYIYIVFIGRLKEAPAGEEYVRVLDRARFILQSRWALYPIALLLLAVLIACYIGLLCVSARRNGDEDLHPGTLNPVPFDLLLAGSVLLSYGLLIWLFPRLSAESWTDYPTELPAVNFVVTFCPVLLLFFGLSMSAAARIKQKTLLSNTLVARLLKLLWQGLRLVWSWLRQIPLVWKTVLLCLLVILCDYLALKPYYEYSSGVRAFASFCVWKDLILLVLTCWLALSFRRLKKAAEKMADGELDYQADTRGMLFDLRSHGQTLSRLGEGMNKAVEERMQSERMKTELITNVSHDLKTPLTSIVNYTELLKQEENLSGQGTEAVEVLSRQSARLKRLIEDLVEASKASSGTLEVDLAPCEASVFVTQASGEYEERLAAAGLTLLTKVPEESLRIQADGRRMWRIFDNLMNNISKYSLPGSRVYLDLERKGNRAVFLFRNTSREPLHISSEELLERFVRGDSSRHTEGNGLGLSIAKSLAELQGGTLQIQIDGDLFKAVLSFPALE